MTDTLPAGTTLVSAVGGTGSTVCAEVQPGVVSCEVGDLDPGESETIFITVHVDPSVPDETVLHNEADATSPTDPDGAQASADTTVRARADLWMEKTGTAPAGNPAGALIYTLTVHNHPGSAPDDTPTSGAGGPSDALDVVVSDPLPLTNKKLKVQFLSPGCTYSLASHTVTCATPVVPFGTSVTFESRSRSRAPTGPSPTRRRSPAPPPTRLQPTTATPSTTSSRAAPARARSPEAPRQGGRHANPSTRRGTGRGLDRAPAGGHTRGSPTG